MTSKKRKLRSINIRVWLRKILYQITIRLKQIFKIMFSLDLVSMALSTSIPKSLLNRKLPIKLRIMEEITLIIIVAAIFLSRLISIRINKSLLVASFQLL